MTEKISVYFFTLTDSKASEHIYMSSLQSALTERKIAPVDNWRDADVVHLFEVNFYSRNALSEFEYLTLLRILRSDIPVVVSTDDLFFLDRPELTARPRLYRLNNLTQRWLFHNCDAIIAISESVKKTLVTEFPVSKIYTVKHGVDSRYRADSIQENEPFILHVSLAAKRKNPPAVVEIARRLNHRFVIAGSGWDEILPDGPGMANVEVVGYLPEDDLIDLYHRASIFYFPTLHEGFGLPVLEAMAAGCAVVTSDVYSIPEVTGSAAVLCDPTDIDTHINEIVTLLEDDETRETLIKDAQRRANSFTWEATAKKTEMVYNDIL